METKKVELSYTQNTELPAAIQKRIKMRTMSAESWIENHGSGTLRKNKKIGFAWQKQYNAERIAYEFGYIFEICPKTRVLFNDPITECDCKAITEAGWFIERYLELSVFPEDYFETKYIIVEEPDGTRREGIGIIVRETSFQVAPGNFIFAIVAEYDHKTKDYMKAKNPF